MELLQPGQALARGVCRLLCELDFAPVTEFVPAKGMRVDVAALSRKGEIWVIECKSCRADFKADHKWQGYLPYCDRFFWAVDSDFPQDLLPANTGLILTDGYIAEILRHGPETPVAAPRRKALTLRLARTAAVRLSRHLDPGLARFASE